MTTFNLSDLQARRDDADVLTETEVLQPQAGGDDDLRLSKPTTNIARIDLPLPPASYTAEEYQTLLDRIQDLEQKLAAAERQRDALREVLKDIADAKVHGQFTAQYVLDECQDAARQALSESESQS